MSPRPSPVRLTYRVSEVADQLGVHRSTVARWVTAGLLRHVKVNGVCLIRPADLEAFLDVHTEGANAPPPAGGDAAARRTKRPRA